MTIDPYKTLGITPQATAEEIRTAYRLLCKTLHPDAGGGKEAFEKIKRAHDLLMDEERRKRYDETGASDEDGDQTITVLQQIFIEILSQSTLKGLESSNVLDAVRIKINDQKRVLQEMLGNLNQVKTAQENTLKIIKKRLKAKKKNFLHAALEKNIENIKLPIMQHEKEIARANEMLSLLDGYEYEFEPADPPANTFGQFSGTFKASRFPIMGYNTYT